MFGLKNFKYGTSLAETNIEWIFISQPNVHELVLGLLFHELVLGLLFFEAHTRPPILYIVFFLEALMHVLDLLFHELQC